MDQAHVYICKSVGYGDSKPEAFHSALESIGIGHYNLVNVSSVIPQNSKVIITDKIQIQKPIGSLLYVVMAESYVSHYADRAVSGLAWILDAENKGLITEATGHDYDKVSRTLDSIIWGMTKDSSWLKEPLRENKILQTAKVNGNRYACALAIAVIDQPQK